MGLADAKDINNYEIPEFYKVLNIGESKSGKTSGFKTFPGKKLAIGLTPRTRPALAGTPDLQLIEIFEREQERKVVRQSAEYSVVPRAWDDLWYVIADLWELNQSDEPFPYDSIMVDDLTAAGHYAMNHTLSLKKKNGEEVPKGLAGAAAQQHYVPQMALMRRLFYTMLLPLPCHIYVTGHITYKENPDTNIAQYYPKVYGNLREEIGSWFDEVYESVREEKIDPKTRVRKLQFMWKTRGYGLKQFIGSTIYTGEDPFIVDLNEKPCGFEKIISLRR